jgi:RNA polymerase sigma-70 factor (ECF subfamily)
VSEQADTALFVCSDEDALFTDLYRRHHRRVRDFCRRRLSPDLVDDAVAEVFLTAWRRIADVPTGDEARLWLYGVAHRVVGHQWRTTARRRRLHDRLRSVESRPMAGADDGLADDDQLRLVVDAAAGLNPTDAEVLRLVAWEQLSAAQVAIVLGIAPNAVKQRLHRAKRNLAREYRRLESRQTSTPDAPKGGSR